MINKKSEIKNDEHMSSKNITDIYDLSVVLKLILLKGISIIPEVGPTLSFLVSIFWPSAKANLWEQIYEKIEDMIEAGTLKLIKELLAGDIMFIQEKIKEVEIILNKHPGSQEAKNSFIMVSHALVGFHKKLSSFDEKINYILLPMYSLSVNLQLCFWINGIEKNKKIGFTEIELDELVSFCENTFEFSKKYINDLYEKNLDHAYNKSDANEVIDNIMSVQSYCSVHGLEHIYIWTQIMEKKTLSEKHDINFISYSSFFGRQTPKMMTLALTNERDFPEPLKPQLINKKRNKITTVKGFIVRIGGAPRVAGIEISFNNGSDYSLGNTSTGEIVEFSLENEVIRRIEVWGKRAIDQLTFYLSDDRIYAFGQNYSNENKKFKISDSHHISGMYLASDDSTLAGQAANFCVSYEMDDLDSSDDIPSIAWHCCK